MEKNVFVAIKAAVVAAIGGFSAAFGWFGWLVLAWAACMLLDWLTGSAAASKDGDWRSERAREGIFHKLGMIVAVGVSLLLDGVLCMILGNIPMVQLPFDYNVLIGPIVICWYIVTEMGSILENVGRMGAPLPGFLAKILAVMKDKTESAGDLFGNTDEPNEKPKE